MSDINDEFVKKVGVLSNLHLHDVNFDKNGTDKLLHSSLTNTNFTLSMLRSRKK